MDQDNQNQSIDGMKPADGSTPASGVDGFMTPQKTNFNLDDMDKAEDSSDMPAPTPLISNNRKSSKAKVWIIVLAILFVVAAVAAGYLYMQYSKTKTDLSTAKQTSDQAVALKLQNDTLTKQNADLQKTVNSQTEYINSLLKVSTQLKTACGKACDAIVIPKAPAAVVTPTPTPSSTAKPTPATTATPKPTVTP